MDHIGIYVRKRESPIYILAQGGGVIEQCICSGPDWVALPNVKQRDL